MTGFIFCIPTTCKNIKYVTNFRLNLTKTTYLNGSIPLKNILYYLELDNYEIKMFLFLKGSCPFKNVYYLCYIGSALCVHP